jgi:hypothetical protein
MKYSCLLLIFALSITHYCSGQASLQGSLVSAYQQSTNGSSSVEWAVGETINETFSKDNFSVSSGLTANISAFITDTEEAVTLYKVHSFPNPFSKVLTIESTEIQFNEVTVDFINVAGKKVEVSQTERQGHRISFSTEHLPSGFYIMTIKHTDKTPLIHIKLIRE